MLNFGIMRHPYNWVLINLVVLLGALALKYVGISAATPHSPGPEE